MKITTVLLYACGTNGIYLAKLSIGCVSCTDSLHFSVTCFINTIFNQYYMILCVDTCKSTSKETVLMCQYNCHNICLHFNLTLPNDWYLRIRIDVKYMIISTS